MKKPSTFYPSAYQSPYQSAGRWHQSADRQNFLTARRKTSKITTLSGCLAALLSLILAQQVNAQASCQYVITNQWGSGATAAIRITNNGAAPISGWNLSWSYNTNRISSSWNANLSGSNPYSASNLSWNSTIQPGQTVEFGLQVNTNNGSVETPVVTGSVCSGVTSSAASSSVASSMPPSSAFSSSSISSVISTSSSSPASGDGNLVISEVTATPENEVFLNGYDWIELYNPSSQPVNLGEYLLADNNSERIALPHISIGAGEYIVVAAVDSETVNPPSPSVPFKLGREDSLSLFRGDEEVDFISWNDGEESKRGRSYGRLNNRLEVLYPTPGYDNVPYVLFEQNEVFTVRVDIPQSSWQAMLANPAAEEYYPANFELNGGVINNVGFRVKGQGSLMFVTNSKRYGFKVDMNRYQDQKFMGMKKLVLNQSFADPSFMRDVISYKIMREAGVPAPETSFVDLWVAGEHLGLYQLVEMIDSEFVERHFPEDEDDKGDLYKGELFQTLQWMGNNIASYRNGLVLKLNEETIGTPDEGKALLTFLNSINNGPDRLAHVDTDLMVKYLAASVLIGNMDSPIGGTANNFYLYEERSRNQFTILPWDYNLAFGLWGNGPAGLGGFGGKSCRVVDHVIDNPVHDTTPRPLFDAILAAPQLKQQYHAELQRLLNGPFNPTYLETEIMRMAELIDYYVQNDPTKFFTYEEWRNSLTQDMPANSNNAGGRGANVYGPAPGLLKHIRERADNVQRQLNGEIPSTNNGGGACP